MKHQPKPVEYETPYKTVILDSPKQLVVKQGHKCINAGIVKHKGKFVPLVVRYDNKPELLGEIETWLEAWSEYNKWFDDQVSIAKGTMTTSTPINFDEAQNNDFTWSYWDGTSGKTLTEKATGQEIYQMRYTDNGKAVEGETKIKGMAFWRALEMLKNEPAKPSLTPAEEVAANKNIERIPARNDHPGWCNHCHSYCYGDCTS